MNHGKPDISRGQSGADYSGASRQAKSIWPGMILRPAGDLISIARSAAISNATACLCQRLAKNR